MSKPLTKAQESALLDQMAMHAMQGLLVDAWAFGDSYSQRDAVFRTLADDAYAMAYAMLGVRLTWQEKL